MRAPISVIIPSLDAEQDIARLSVQLYDGVHAGLISELIISDGGSSDDTLALAEDLGAVVIQGPAGRGGQIARGCVVAHGAWVFILHADTVLPMDWQTRVRAAMSDHRSAAYYFDLRFDAKGVAPWVVATWANLRSRLFKLPYGDQGLFIRHSHLKRIDGYPDAPIMEDVILANKLRADLRPIGSHVTTRAEKFEQQGWLRRGARNLVLLMRFFAGASPDELYRSYYGHKS